MLELLKNNPQYVTGVVRAVLLAAAVAAGITVTKEQEVALVVVIAMLVTVATSKLTVPKVVADTAPDASVQVVEYK